MLIIAAAVVLVIAVGYSFVYFSTIVKIIMATIIAIVALFAVYKLDLSVPIMGKFFGREYYRSKFRIKKWQKNKKYILEEFGQVYLKVMNFLVMITHGPRRGFGVLAGSKPLGIDFSSNGQRRYKHKKAEKQKFLEEFFQLYKYKQKKSFYSTIVSLLVVMVLAIAVNMIIFNILAASNSWTQDDWTGGASTSATATHSSDQTGWDKFFSVSTTTIDTSTSGSVSFITNNKTEWVETGYGQGHLDFGLGTFTGRASYNSTTVYLVVLADGDGSDGNLNVTSGTTTLDTDANPTGFDYGSVNVAAGAVLTATGSKPLLIRATTSVTISGKIDLDGLDGEDSNNNTPGGGGYGRVGGKSGGAGGQGGVSGGAVDGSGDGGGLGGDAINEAGGGAGYATVGSDGENNAGSGGASYGDDHISAMKGGSGGGGGAGDTSNCVLFDACIDGSDWLTVTSSQLSMVHRNYNIIGTDANCPNGYTDLIKVAGTVHNTLAIDGSNNYTIGGASSISVDISDISSISVLDGRGTVTLDADADQVLIDDDSFGNGDVYQVLLCSSASAAGGGGGGGAGGGIMQIIAPTVTFNTGSEIYARGGDGGNGDAASGGGGSGGAIIVYSQNYTNNGTVSVAGGAGGLAGADGGAGAAGRTKNMTIAATADSGTYTSRVASLDGTVSLETFSWNTTTPVNTNATFRYRAGNSSNTADASWTSWTAITDNGADLSSTFGEKSYAQYELTLSTTAVTSTGPSMSAATTTFSVMSDLISSPYNTENSNASISNLVWGKTLPTGSDLKFRLRTSPDNSTWTDWLGPTATTDYYTTSTGNTINSSNSDGSGDQWVQYRAYFFTNDNTAHPSLEGVTISYGQSVCGDGIVDSGEECDNGTAGNGDCPAVCSSSCLLNGCQSGGGGPTKRTCGEVCRADSNCDDTQGYFCYQNAYYYQSCQLRGMLDFPNCAPLNDPCPGQYGYLAGDLNNDGRIDNNDLPFLVSGSLTQENAELDGDLVITADDGNQIIDYYNATSSSSFDGIVGQAVCYDQCSKPQNWQCAYNTYYLGDVNNDNVVSTLDAMLVMAYVQGRYSLSSVEKIAADVDKDGDIDEDDAYAIYNRETDNICEAECDDRPGLLIKIQVGPEKRTPYSYPVWKFFGSLQIQASGGGSILVEKEFETDDSGYAEVVVPLEDLNGLPGCYNIGVKGISHLRKVDYRLYVSDGNQETYLDYTYGRSFNLLAGDVVSDNMVNSLDLNYLENRLYSDSYASDLDWNGIINGLDLNIAEYNIYREGDEFLNHSLCESEDSCCGNTNAHFTISACTDPDAVNYNPMATIDNNSCRY